MGTTIDKDKFNPLLFSLEYIDPELKKKMQGKPPLKGFSVQLHDTFIAISGSLYDNQNTKFSAKLSHELTDIFGQQLEGGYDAEWEVEYIPNTFTCSLEGLTTPTGESVSIYDPFLRTFAPD